MKSSGLVGHWPLDDIYSDTSVAYDKSRMKNNGTVTGATLATDGKSMVFDGSTSYIDVTNNTSLNFGTDDFAIIFWFRTSNPSSTLTYPRIVSKGASDDGERGFSVIIGGTFNKGRIAANIGNGVSRLTTEIISGDTFNDNQWHYVVVNYDRSAFLSLYVDTILYDSEDISSFASEDISNSLDLTIGATYSSSLFFNGNISDVKIYSHALDAGLILDEYNNTKNNYIG